MSQYDGYLLLLLVRLVLFSHLLFAHCECLKKINEIKILVSFFLLCIKCILKVYSKFCCVWFHLEIICRKTEKLNAVERWYDDWHNSYSFLLVFTISITQIKNSLNFNLNHLARHTCTVRTLTVNLLTLLHMNWYKIKLIVLMHAHHSNIEGKLSGATIIKKR